jgi:hypothetical protein
MGAKTSKKSDKNTENIGTVAKNENLVTSKPSDTNIETIGTVGQNENLVASKTSSEELRRDKIGPNGSLHNPDGLLHGPLISYGGRFSTIF